MNNLFDSNIEYEKFVMAMCQAAEIGNLPVMCECRDPSGISIEDIHEFINTFKQDTPLSVEFNIGTCDECGRIHVRMLIDYPEEYYDDEDEDDYPDQPHILQ